MKKVSRHKKYWEKYAPQYNKIVGDRGDISHSKIINPIVLELVDDLNERVVLDAGCGNGYLSNQFAKSARRVVGVDFTEELIEVAKNRYRGDNIEFIVGDLEHLDFLNDGFFDVVVCNMVLMDVEDLSKVVGELSRVLKKYGILVASITHPCFENPPNTYSLKNKDGDKIGRVVANYFKTGLIIDKTSTNQAYQHFHYTISEYLNTFSEVGLRLRKLVEPNGAEMLGSKDKDHIPYFLIMKCSKEIEV